MRAVRIGVRGRRSLAALATAAALLGGGLLGSGAAPAQAAVSVPSWLVGVETVSGSVYKKCSAVELTGDRLLMPVDCITGRGVNDSGFIYNGGNPEAGFHIDYHADPRYNAQTRQADYAVMTVGQDTTVHGPALASTADAALYSPGAKATFSSWAGSSPASPDRHTHSEQVAILSSATCAAHLGHAQLSGTFCTLPAPGTTPPPAGDRCSGDAGGVLVAGGKVLGISATPAGGCIAADGLRLYTNVSAYRAQMLGWAHDIDYNFIDTGSVTSRQAQGHGGVVAFCGINPVYGKLVGCTPNSGALVYELKPFTFFTEAGDLNGDGAGEVLARTPGGALYSYGEPSLGQNPNLDTTKGTWLSNGWGHYTSIFSERDFSGDGIPDLIARDTSGNLWLYKGNGKGNYGARSLLGQGFNAYTQLTGRGDYSGDGLADFLGVDKAGTLWLFKGNGRSGFTRVKFGTGFSGYRELVASGDIDHDGRQDLFGRTPGGGVFVINATTNGTGMAAPRLYAKNYFKYITQVS
ncbi:FG-GAP-like repeat-containing protein [Streptomyces sp. CA-111067]|uniref:FG-GAP-like repeat-containing protein n=1 Tax=Streptomyces sp. CA-111067 TaxID=3240046 RepID=UPI003D98C333